MNPRYSASQTGALHGTVLNGQNHKGVRFVALLLFRISCPLHVSCGLKSAEFVAWEHDVPFGSLLVTLGGVFPQLLSRAMSPSTHFPGFIFDAVTPVLWAEQGSLGTQLCQTRASKYAGWCNATLQTTLDGFSSVLKDTDVCTVVTEFYTGIGIGPPWYSS